MGTNGLLPLSLDTATRHYIEHCWMTAVGIVEILLFHSYGDGIWHNHTWYVITCDFNIFEDGAAKLISEPEVQVFPKQLKK